MYTVIFAEDELDIRTAIVNSLDWAKLGFEIVGEASNGVEALELIEEKQPDLLITDIKMPIMSGIDLARAARDIRPAMQMVFLTGYDQFEFTKQAIKYNILEYLLKPISPEKLEEEFLNIKKKMDQKYSEIRDVNQSLDVKNENIHLKKEIFLSELINFDNVLNVPKKMKEINLDHMLNGDNKKYTLITVKNLNEIKNEEDNLLMKRTMKMVQVIASKYFQIETFIYGNKIMLLCCDTEINFNKYMKIMLEDLASTGERVLERKTYIGMSKYFYSLNKMRQAYLETQSALNYIENSENPIISISDIETETNRNVFDEIILSFDEKIKIGNEKDLDDYLNNIFIEVQKNQMSKWDVNALVLEMIFICYQALRAVDKEATIDVTLIKQLDFNRNFKDIENEIKKIARNASKSILNVRQNNSNILAEEAMTIITQEFDNVDMSLNLLSDKLHCSPNYLSRVIKKGNGDSFINLLTKQRMINAKELLLCTNKKVLEISENVGYSDQHYFSYCFKKYYGISPNKMRKSAMEN